MRKERKKDYKHKASPQGCSSSSSSSPAAAALRSSPSLYQQQEEKKEKEEESQRVSSPYSIRLQTKKDEMKVFRLHLSVFIYLSIYVLTSLSSVIYRQSISVCLFVIDLFLICNVSLVCLSLSLSLSSSLFQCFFALALCLSASIPTASANDDDGVFFVFLFLLFLLSFCVLVNLRGCS